MSKLVVGGQPKKKNTKIPVIKQQNTSKALLTSDILEVHGLPKGKETSFRRYVMVRLAREWVTNCSAVS